MRLGLSLPSAALYRQRGQPLAPETAGLLARMSVPPSPARRTHIDTLVKSLIAAGLWTKLDALYLLAAHDAQAARLNLVPWTGTVTNALTNSAFVGAAPGVVPDGVTLTGFAAGTGNTYEIQGVDIVNGQRFLRLRLYGTSVGVGAVTFSVRSDANVDIGQRWTTSASVELVSGSWVAGLSAVTLRLNSEGGGSNFIPGARAQYTNTRVVTTTFAGSNLVLRYSTPTATTTPVTYDVVLRIGMPQLVRMDVPGDYIPTSGAAASQVQTLARFDLSAVNSPVFTVDRGYSGNGTTSYLDTNADPSVDFARASLNSAAYGAWASLNIAATNQHLMGDTAARVIVTPRLANDSLTIRAHSPSGLSSPAGSVTSSLGLSVANRDGASSRGAYKNGVLVVGDTAAPTAMPADLFVLRAGAAYSANQISAAFAGASMTAAQHLALYSALRSYLLAVGAAS